MHIQHVCARAAMVAVIAMIGGCAIHENPIPPEVRMVDLRPAGGGLLEQVFQIDLRVANPNDFDLDIDGVRADLEVNGQRFASGLSNQAVTVPRLGSAILSVEASTGVIDLARQLFGLAETGNLEYRLTGTAYLGGFGQSSVPFEQTGSLDFGSTLGGIRTLVPQVR